MPEETQIIVCKNSLMVKATERVERFSPLRDSMKVQPGSSALAAPEHTCGCCDRFARRLHQATHKTPSAAARSAVRRLTV